MAPMYEPGSVRNPMAVDIALNPWSQPVTAESGIRFSRLNPYFTLYLQHLEPRKLIKSPPAWLRRIMALIPAASRPRNRQSPRRHCEIHE